MNVIPHQGGLKDRLSRLVPWRHNPPPPEVEPTPDVPRPARTMTRAEVRALVESRTPRTVKQHVDINRLPFGMEIEMEGVGGVIGAWLPIKLMSGWNVNGHHGRWKIVPDGSVVGGEVVSPVMRLQGGRAEQQIRRVYGHLARFGAHASPHCGLHVHVDGSTLGPRGLAILMQMAVENEALLYGISQNGGREHRPFKYNKPYNREGHDFTPLLRAESIPQFRREFYRIYGGQPRRYHESRYHGINFNSYFHRGTIEFRLFDATNDPAKAIADLHLALGMVKAASEEDYAFLEAGPQATSSRPQVGRESFNYFLSKVAPAPALRQRLEKLFADGGGQVIDDPPLSKKAGQRLLSR